MLIDHAAQSALNALADLDAATLARGAAARVGLAALDLIALRCWRLRFGLSHYVASSQPQRAQRCRYLRLLFSRWLIAVPPRAGRQLRVVPL